MNHWWQFGIASNGTDLLNLMKLFHTSLVTTWMGNGLQTNKPSWYHRLHGSAALL